MTTGSIIYRLGKLPLIGRALRWYANRYPEGSVVTIRRGLLAGMRWKRHHRYVNGYWLGIIEPIVQETFAQHIKLGDVVWDIGANAGFFTLLAARLSGDDGQVIAFDPQPSNQESIREQAELNGVHGRVSVRPEAISDAPGTAHFVFGGEGDPAGRLGDADERRPEGIEVQCITLDALLDELPAPNVIKMDIEGAERSAFRGALGLIEKHQPLIILEVHAPDIADELRPLLAKWYDWQDIEAPTIDAQGNPAPWHVVLAPRKADA